MFDEHNKVTLCGIVTSNPEFSHEIYGENFFDFFITVPRLSMEEDVLSVTMSEKLIVENLIEQGSEIAICGQLRSYNKIINGKSKLCLTVFAKQVIEKDSISNVNSIELEGYVCKPTIYRTTPFSREICDILVAVNRAYNKSDYLPCIAWGRNAQILRKTSVGEKIEICGRIQSRKYQKKLDDGEIVEKIAYEISISKLQLSGRSGYFYKEETKEEIASTIDF